MVVVCPHTFLDGKKSDDLLVEFRQPSVKRDAPGLCAYIYDIDGTTFDQWSGTPLHLNCQGNLTIQHDAHIAKMDLEASSDEGGEFHDTTLTLKKRTDENGKVIGKEWRRHNHQTYCDDTSGTPPDLTIRQKGRRVWTPNSLWDC